MAKTPRGKSIYPAPVAVAEFAAGEKIRMSFWQPAQKPWRFDAARRLVAQTIGNERARNLPAVADTRADAQRVKKIKALHDRPGTEGEKAAAAEAIKRIAVKRSAKEIMEGLAAFLDNLARYNGHQPAMDFVAFHVEHDGQRYDEASAPLSFIRKSKIQSRTQTINEPKTLVALMSEIESRLGNEFLDTKAWRRVRARAKALSRDMPANRLIAA